MKVNIYYGGRGLIEDPTIYVINKMAAVLSEIRVEVTRYNLYEEKNSITMLPKTLKEADGMILATHLEWMGIGGYMQEFLDACWLYGDKEKISSLYMMPVVLAETYGEREAEQTLVRAWDLLGGISCNGLSAYVENHLEFETNPDYANEIEKKAESLYRSINQRQINLPSSNHAVKAMMLRTNSIDLTPQESEQLSIYVSDDSYVKKQKEDIEELTKIFKEMLDPDEADESNEKLEKKKLESKVSLDTAAQRKPPYQAIFQKTNTLESLVPERTDLHEKAASAHVEVSEDKVSMKPESKEESRNSSKNITTDNKQEKKTIADVTLPKSTETRKETAAVMPYISNFKKNFKPMTNFQASYAIHITDMNRILIVEASSEKLICYYGDKEDADVIAKTSKSVMDQLIQGRITFQNAFMSGALTAKGNFKTLRVFDTIFQFNIL